MTLLLDTILQHYDVVKSLEVTRLFNLNGSNV
jgi:hypothetical protein